MEAVVFRMATVRVILLIVKLMRWWSMMLVMITIIMVLSMVLESVMRRSMMLRRRTMMLERGTSARWSVMTFTWRSWTWKVSLSRRATRRWLIMIMSRWWLLMMWRRRRTMVRRVRTRLIARWSVTAFVTVVLTRAALAFAMLGLIARKIVLLSSVFDFRLQVA